MNIALDIGTSAFRTLRRQESRLFGRQCPAVYVSLPNGAAQRRLLQQAEVPFSLCDDALIVTGSEAVDVAESWNLPTVPLLPEGRMPIQDPLSRQVAAALIDAVLPLACAEHPSSTRPPICTMIVPGNPQREGNPEIEFFARLVSLRGYDPVILSAGHAVALAELGNASFSGVGISVGATFSSICITHRGQVLAESTLPLGTNRLDQFIAERLNRFLWDAAGNRYFDLSSANQLRRQVSFPLSKSHSTDARVAGEVMGELLIEIGNEYGKLLERVRGRALAETQSLPVVLCGGITRIDGLLSEVQTRWNGLSRLRSTGEIRLAGDPLWTPSRGCLIAAEVEGSTLLNTPTTTRAA